MTREEIQAAVDFYEDKLPHMQAKVIMDFLDNHDIKFDYEGCLVKDVKANRLVPVFCFIDVCANKLEHIEVAKDNPRIGNFMFSLSTHKAYDGGTLDKPLHHKFEIYYDATKNLWHIRNWVSKTEDMDKPILNVNETDCDGLIGYINRFIEH